MAAVCGGGDCCSQRLPAGHAEPAQVYSAALQRVLFRPQIGALSRSPEPFRNWKIRLRDQAQLDPGSYYLTGKHGNVYGNELPMPPLTPADRAQVLARGQERYNIYCTPCHSLVGDGNGMIVQRGYKRPPSFHVQRLRNAPLGYFYDVISNGFGGMPDYASQVKPADRWAIAAYIRALQLSQHATGRRCCRPKDIEQARGEWNQDTRYFAAATAARAAA